MKRFECSVDRARYEMSNLNIAGFGWANTQINQFGVHELKETDEKSNFTRSIKPNRGGKKTKTKKNHPLTSNQRVLSLRTEAFFPRARLNALS